MNESNIFLVLQNLPANNTIYKLVFEQLVDSIDDTGNCDLSTPLAIKIFKRISEKRSIARLNKNTSDKILKFF